MPSARASRALVVALSCLAAAATHGAPDRKAPSERELQEMRGRIEQLQKDLAAAEESRGEAVDQLRESGRAVSESQRALFELAQGRRTIEAGLEDLARQEREARAGMSEQEALAARLLRLQHRQGAPDRLRLALEGRDAATAARHIQYYDYIQRARAGLIGELRAKGERLAALERDAAARRDELAENEAERGRETQRLEKERAERAAVVAKLAGDIARNRAEIGKLKRDEARLARLVQEIAKALAARPAPPKGAAKESAKGRPVDRVADASTAAQPFAQLQGRLRLPVRGEIAGRYGAAREEPGSTWKGLFIRAVTGATVHAVADGRVVYADWLRGFGNLLILDHGGGFMSLYAYADSLLRPVGETVRSGDVVAHAGASGGQPESGLYFELRRDGKPFDPMRWVAQ